MGHRLQGKLLGFRIPVEGLSLQFTAHLVEQAVMASAAELAEQGLIPGHRAFHHEFTVLGPSGLPYTKGPQQRG
jgi:hypothetical protein